MTVCHLLLGRPWQYDRNVTHEGRTNTYTFKMDNQNMKLFPMTPNQILAQSLQKKVEVKLGDDKISLKGRQGHEENKLVMITNKFNVKEIRCNPELMHIILVYKDTLITTNDITNLPSSVSQVLQDYIDVFPP